MSKFFTKEWSAVKGKFNLLKKWVPHVLILISIVLVAQTLYCYSSAENFPVGASDLTRTGYDPTLSSNLPELYSIVDFLPGHIKSEIDCEITLTSLEEVGVKWTEISYLTDNSTLFEGTVMHLFPIDKMHDPAVTINGQTATLYLSNVTGTQSYAVNGFNLSDTSQVARVMISFNVERAASNNKFVKIPWVFNENYAQYIKFPAMGIPVEENRTSDESTFKIDFELPFRQLVTSMSGWVDEFDLPYSYWVFLNSSAYYEIMVEYPINQTVYSSGNTYYFKTNFSKQNVADSYMITIVPSLEVILFLLPFMLSPIYTFIGDYGLNKYEKLKNLRGFFRLIYGFALAYGPIIGFIVLLTGVVQSLSLSSYLLDIMSPLGLFVFSLPLISLCCVMLRKTTLKTWRETKDRKSRLHDYGRNKVGVQE